MTKKKTYYAVIFTSKQTVNTNGYHDMSSYMETLAKKQKGFISMDSVRNNIGITVSYWETLEDIKNWKYQSDHLKAQEKGKNDWYSWYHVRICTVEHEYDFGI